jgi:predicted aldo/keto reductase-like oxidoreductase
MITLESAMKRTPPKNDLTRREFMTKGTIGLGFLGFMGMTSDQIQSEIETKNPNQKQSVIYRTLGQTGIKIPIVSMGVMNAHLKDLVMESYNLGVRHFDTAWAYQRGRNEKMVGEAIQQLGVRKEVIIGTKIRLRGIKMEKENHKEIKQLFLNQFEESLERLQTNYVDILYIHNVTSTETINFPGIQEALNELKEKKKTRFIGFSSHANMTALLKDAIKSKFYDVALISFNYAMAEDTEYLKTLEKAAAGGIGLIAMKTQCQQGWYKYNLPSEQKSYYEGKIIHSALLKWVLRHEFITTAVPGYTTFEQMRTDFPVAYDLNYSPEEKKFLKDRNIKTSLKSCCQQCHICVSTCPKGVNIPELMRTHMYAAHYANFYQARDTINAIPKEHGLEACSNCQNCTAQCVNQVNIADKIEELKLIYS